MTNQNEHAFIQGAADRLESISAPAEVIEVVGDNLEIQGHDLYVLSILIDPNVWDPDYPRGNT